MKLGGGRVGCSENDDGIRDRLLCSVADFVTMSWKQVDDREVLK